MANGSGNATSFGWLHLSDLRLCPEQRGWFWQSLRDVFWEDLRRLHNRSGPWDLVAITGNLTEHASIEEFRLVDEVVSQVMSHLRALGSQPVLLTMPGNHDIVHSRGYSLTTLLNNWDKTQTGSEYWSDRDSFRRSALRSLFKEYLHWSENSTEFPSNVRHGIFPGDFTFTIQKQTVRLGVLGLNTAFGRGAIGGASVDSRQFHAAAGGDGPGWAAAHDACLLMTHHSPRSLEPNARNALQEIAVPGRFVAHLCGGGQKLQHSLDEIRRPPCIVLEAPVAFGLHGLQTGGDPNLGGYWAGRLEISEDRGVLRMWPRTTRITRGRMRIGADPLSDLEDDGALARSIVLSNRGRAESAKAAVGLELVGEAVESETKDPRRWLTTVPIEALGRAVDVVSTSFPYLSPHFGRERLALLADLAQAANEHPAKLLVAAARAMGLDRHAPVSGDLLLPVDIPRVGLPLPRTDTVLTIVRPCADPERDLHDRLQRAAFHYRIPPLVLHLARDPRAIPGVILVETQDLLSIAVAEHPRRALASVLWQRSDLQDLSPYQEHSAVTEATMFYGRDHDRHEISAHGQRRCLLLVGPRRIGKSSLMVQARDEICHRGGTAIYIILRKTVASPSEIAGELMREAGMSIRIPSPSSSYCEQVRFLGRFVREKFYGATLLFDEADHLLAADRLPEHQSACSEEIRALVHEQICTVVLAGYGTLYRAALSQSEPAYNLGVSRFLGPLDRKDALRLATEPMNRIGVSWADPRLPERLVDAVGSVPHLVQKAGRYLLLRLRGPRNPVLDAEDLEAVLGSWRPRTEPNSLRDELIKAIEVNLRGPAQAAVWLLASRQDWFTREQLDRTLRENGFIGLRHEQLIEVSQSLEIAGTCRRDGDRFAFAIPLLVDAVADQSGRGHDVRQLAAEWQGMTPADRQAFNFWGGVQ